MRYPEDIFAVQSAIFATYHMTQPAVFYNREDQWEIPTVQEGSNAQAMQPYYTIMRLPGESEAEFIQMLPFTPRRRDNLAAWLVARSDAEHYGRLRVFEFPKQKLVFGPHQVVARINQDQTISPQITLWNQQGSQVIWGTLMVIPIEESLIYVRPLYLRSAGGRSRSCGASSSPTRTRSSWSRHSTRRWPECSAAAAAAPAHLMPKRATASQPAVAKRPGERRRRRRCRRTRRALGQHQRARRRGAHPLRPRVAGAARRRLGEVRRGAQAARRACCSACNGEQAVVHSAVSNQARSTSATLQAWAMQPRGV